MGDVKGELWGSSFGGFPLPSFLVSVILGIAIAGYAFMIRYGNGTIFNSICLFKSLVFLLA